MPVCSDPWKNWPRGLDLSMSLRPLNWWAWGKGQVGVAFTKFVGALLQARLQAQLQALHNTVKSKDAEIASLRQAVLTKDMIVRVSCGPQVTLIPSSNGRHLVGPTART